MLAVRDRNVWLTALVIFGISLVYFLSYMRYGLAYDEGYLLDGVERILQGQVIYRDFHHTYAPGRFYLIAAAFKLLGNNLLVERFVFAVLEALKCGLAFLIVRSVVKGPFALLAPVLIAIAPGPWHKVFFSSCGFLGLYAAMLAAGSRPRRMLGYGAIIGGVAVFRQDVAGFALIAGISGVIIEGLSERHSLRTWVLKTAGLFAGAGLVIAPVLAYFYSRGALGMMIHKITVDGMLDNMTNRIRYPALTAAGSVDGQYLASVMPVRLLFYLPFAVYGLSLALIVKGLIERGWGRRYTNLAVVSIVSVLAFNQSVWRSDLGHLLQTMQYVFLLVPAVLAAAYSMLVRRMHAGRPARLALMYALLLIGPVMLVWASIGCVRASTDEAVAARFMREGVSVGDTEYLGSVFVRVGNDTPLGLDRAPIYVTRGEALFFGALGAFLNAHTAPGDYVLAVPQLQMIYFLYDRRNPTRYAHYRRSLDPEEEARYIRDIETHRTEYIFLTEPFEGARLGETRESFSQYASRVRTWILEHYVMVDSIGWVKVLRRKS